MEPKLLDFKKNEKLLEFLKHGSESESLNMSFQTTTEEEEAAESVACPYARQQLFITALLSSQSAFYTPGEPTEEHSPFSCNASAC